MPDWVSVGVPVTAIVAIDTVVFVVGDVMVTTGVVRSTSSTWRDGDERLGGSGVARSPRAEAARPPDHQLRRHERDGERDPRALVRVARLVERARVERDAAEVAARDCDVPTLARHASALPASARIFLFGTDERQRARIVAQFPDAAGWIATTQLPGPDVLLGDLEH